MTDGVSSSEVRRVRTLVTTLALRVQQLPDGSFPQNSDVAGRPVWSELQLDEVALPIALARLTGAPARGTRYGIGDGGPAAVDQRRVVDPSFLALVRFGLLPPADRAVRRSLRVVDQELRIETPNGPFWRRFSFDGYGETRAGRQWRVTEPGSRRTLGRAWPLLIGERGE